MNQKDNLAMALVQELIMKEKEVNYSLGVQIENEDVHYLVTVQVYSPKKIQNLMESVLYPTAKNVCGYCGK